MMRRGRTEAALACPLTRRAALRLAGGVAAMAALGSCTYGRFPQTRKEFPTRSFFAFDTLCTVGGALDESALDDAQALCERFERLFSRTIPSSDIGRINAAHGEAVDVDPLTAEIVRAALVYCEESRGLFDITIGAVSELWNFSDGVVAESAAIERALPHVDWRTVQVRDHTVRLLDAQARLDLGGIAKGFIADKLIGLFAERGAEDAFVNLGGNVAVMGHNEQGRAWSVGVRDPFDESGNGVAARVSATAGSLVTSGLYERSFEQDGRRWWHILDPRTGYPVETSVVSASVFSRESVDGDGYTKPLFMLGRDEALGFIEAHGGLEALLIENDGTAYATRGASFELL